MGNYRDELPETNGTNQIHNHPFIYSSTYKLIKCFPIPHTGWLLGTQRLMSALFSSSPLELPTAQSANHMHMGEGNNSYVYWDYRSDIHEILSTINSPVNYEPHNITEDLRGKKH